MRKILVLLADAGCLMFRMVMLVEVRSTGPPILPLGIIKKLPKGTTFFHTVSPQSRDTSPATHKPTTRRCVPPMPRATGSKG